MTFGPDSKVVFFCKNHKKKGGRGGGARLSSGRHSCCSSRSDSLNPTAWSASAGEIAAAPACTSNKPRVDVFSEPMKGEKDFSR